MAVNTKRRHLDVEGVIALMLEFGLTATIDENVDHRGMVWYNGQIVAFADGNKFSRWGDVYSRMEVMQFVAMERAL